MPDATPAPVQLEVPSAPTPLVDNTQDLGTVRIQNLHHESFVGWVTCILKDRASVPSRGYAHLPGRVSASFIRGRNKGLDSVEVDFYVAIEAGCTLTIDRAQMVEEETVRVSDAALTNTFRVAVSPGPSVTGEGGNFPLALAKVEVFGAAWYAKFEARRGPIFFELCAKWYPDHPGLIMAEFRVTHSDPSSPELTHTVPGSGYFIRWNHGVVVPVSERSGLPPGAVIADGQTHVFPVSVLFLDLVNFATTRAAAHVWQRVKGHGQVRLHPGAAPFHGMEGMEEHVRHWVAQHYESARSSLGARVAPMLGPAADSGQTGSQEDQTFHPGVEALLIPCAILPRYFAALGFGRRPCHHLERDGSIVTRERRPGLRMFYGRPFRATTSDTLGKPRDLTIQEAGGWNGPDAQHWFFGTLYAVCMLDPSPSAQWLLEHEARRYLIERTTVKGLGTSDPFSAREIGWEGLAVVRLWYALDDRTLAAQVRDHFLTRLGRVIIPWIGGYTIWQIIKDDARVGTGDWWLAWHQAIGAYGMSLAARVFGHDTAAQVAFNGAKQVLDDAWEAPAQPGGRWTEYENLALDGQRKHRSGFFTTAWLPCALQVVLQHEPENEKARAILAQVRADVAHSNTIQATGWLPPEVLA